MDEQRVDVVEMPDEIKQAIKIATELVESWPLWKRNILKHSGEPTVYPPRKPVNNFEERD
jgi:hypothetical protein